MRFPPALIRTWAIALGLSLALSICPKAVAAHSELDKVDLFQKGENGIALFRIPGIVVTTKGTTLVYCEARGDARSDWGEIQIHLRRSVDGGKSWEPARQIAHLGERIPGNPHKVVGGENEQTVNNPVAVVDHESGAIHFLYCVNYARAFYMRSEDDGLTFSEPVEITQAFEGFRAACDWKVIATGPGHGLQLRNGRLVVPVWLAYGKVGQHGPSVSGTIYSEDHGRTWKAGTIAFPNTGAWKDPNETALAELSDGRVMLNARSGSAASRRLVTVSPNGISDWAIPQFDPALWEPKCMGSLLRLPTGGPRGQLLFCHPHSLKTDPTGREIPGASGLRKNLSIQISKDDGQTWSEPHTVEEGTSAYSDLAVLRDGTTLCFYERKDVLTLARISPEWLAQSASARNSKPPLSGVENATK